MGQLTNDTSHQIQGAIVNYKISSDLVNETTQIYLDISSEDS